VDAQFGAVFQNGISLYALYGVACQAQPCPGGTRTPCRIHVPAAASSSPLPFPRWHAAVGWTPWRGPSRPSPRGPALGRPGHRLQPPRGRRPGRHGGGGERRAGRLHLRRLRHPDRAEPAGGGDYIAALLLEEKAGIRLNHIPFNGTSQILVPLLGGQLEVGAFNLSEALPLLRDRAIRAIALAAPERDAAAPDIPTYRESGVDLVFSAGRGLFAPPKLPEPIRTALEAALAAIFADPAWAEAAARAGLILHPLVGTAYREAALGGEAALRALWNRRPWKE